MAKTFFGAMSRHREVNWGVILLDVVRKTIGRTEKKSSPISPYLFDLDYCWRTVIRKLEELTTQPQLRVEKERLEIQVKELRKDLARKSEEIRYSMPSSTRC